MQIFFNAEKTKTHFTETSDQFSKLLKKNCFEKKKFMVFEMAW